MRTFFAISAISLSSLAAAAPLPDMSCTEQKVLQVQPGSLRSEQNVSSSTYRFAAGKLFIQSGSEPEYAYNTVNEAEPGRYVSGHKIIYVRNVDSKDLQLQLTHVYKDEIRVSVAECKRK
jgi:hypothetical protein